MISHGASSIHDAFSFQEDGLCRAARGSSLTLGKEAMSDTNPDKEFWELADAFIAFANQKCNSAPRGKVSSAQLYAAARFNCFVSASSAETKEQFAAKREERIAYFVSQFESMLRENFSDYEANYEKYVRGKKEA